MEPLVKVSVPDKLTLYQEEVLIGHLLGDGCLYRDKSAHTPYLSFTRCRKDREYLEWTENIFRSFSKHGVQDFDSYDARTNKVYFGCRFNTRRVPVFIPYYANWYPQDIKLVPADLVLTPLILAVWYFDDGSLYLRSPAVLNLKLSTEGFAPADVKRLAEMLSTRYGKSFTITGNAIRAANQATRAFIAEIDSALPPGMGRKILWRNQLCRH